MNVKSNLTEMQVKISNLLQELLADQTGKEVEICLRESQG